MPLPSVKQEETKQVKKWTSARMNDINKRSSHAWKGLQLNIFSNLLSKEMVISCQEYTGMINYAFIYALNSEHGRIKVSSSQQLRNK